MTKYVSWRGFAGVVGAGTRAREIIISGNDKNVYSLDLSSGTVRAYDRDVFTGVLTYNTVNSLPAGINPSGIYCKVVIKRYSK